MTVMHRYNNYAMWFIAFLLLIIIGAGCGDPDKTVNPGLIPPTVLSVTPSDGVCPNTVVTATFSKAMNPATINTSTFTLTTGTPPVAVAGVVTYDASSNTAIFAPSNTLGLSTTYTATITTGATDTFGNALAADKVWMFTTSATPCTTPPTVISVTPANGVCPDTTVTATFSEAMNPATINTTTFTLTGPGGAVAGTVTYDVPSRVATFTQTSPPLALDTTYTATITTGAQDLFGVPLASAKVWTFTTSATACPGTIPLPPPSCLAGIVAGQAISSTGLSIVSGDLDISPLTSITGFPPGILTNGGVKHIADPTAATAQTQLTTAYTTASTLPTGTHLPPDIGGSTLPPGVYTTVAQPSLGITGNLTLDPVGDPNAVWIFQISSTLTTAGGIVNVLPPGKPGNVFWAIGSAATLGTGTTMAGNLMAQAAITMNTGATLNGRALARTAGAVSIQASTINVPPCP
jgi:Ice-binding-like/Bacterial Ig-like domain